MIPRHHSLPSPSFPIATPPTLSSSSSPPASLPASRPHCLASPRLASACLPSTSASMDPCPFVRVLVGNLALKLPSTTSPSPSTTSSAGSGVHPTTAPCYVRIRLNNLPYQTASAPLLPSTEEGPASCTGAFAAAFHVSKSDLDRSTTTPSPLLLLRRRLRTRIGRLKIAVYAGRCGVGSGISCGGGGAGGAAGGGRLIGKLVIPVDLTAALKKPVVFHSGWVAIGKKKKRRGGGRGKAVVEAGGRAQLNLTVRAEPDPRFVFEFDGEPECSPQVMQVKGSMKQPMFTCKFSCRSNSDLRSRSMHSDPGGGGGGGATGPRHWLSKLGSDRERSGKERKGWSVTVHDLSGSPVALASMVTPFVASPGTDRVSRSNPGAWLILRPVDGTWTPWGRLECWRDRGVTGGDTLGCRFELVPDHTTTNTTVGGAATGVCVAESGVPASRGGRFAIDLTALEPFGSPAGCSPRGSGEFGGGGGGRVWPFGNFRGFVMAAEVQGEGRCSKPTVEVGVAHVGCAEDAAAFVALAAAVDLSMDACRLFSCKLRRELSASRADLLR